MITDSSNLKKIDTKIVFEVMNCCINYIISLFANGRLLAIFQRILKVSNCKLSGLHIFNNNNK